MNRFFVALLLALSCGKGASNQSAVTWRAANGNLGSAITVDQLVSSSDGALYAIVGQNLFKSTDGAVSWQAAGPAAFPGVQAIAVQPDQPAVLYALTAQTSGSVASYPLIRSPDHGATWSQAADLETNFGANSTPSGLLKLGTGSPPAVYIGADSIFHGNTSLLYSGDGGASFTQTSAFSDLIVSQANPMVAYSFSPSGASNGAVLKSTDNGAHFTQVFVDNSGVGGLDVGATPNDIYVVGQAGAISHAFTGTPSSVTTASMSLPQASSLVAGALDPNVVLLIALDGQVFVSTDSAVSFSAQNGGLPARPGMLVADQARKGVFYALVPGSGLYASSSITP
jgi:hypothetical protein